MGQQVISQTTAYQWDWPTGVTMVVAEGIGGGGAGAWGAANPAYCGGGKGGSYARKRITKGAETYLTVTAGAGGTSAVGTGYTHGQPSTVVQDGSTVMSAAGGQTPPQNDGVGSSTINGSNTGDVSNEGGNGGPYSGTYSGGGGGAAGPSGVGGNAAASGSPPSGGVHGGGNFLDGSDYCGAGANGVAVRNVGLQGNQYGGAGSGGSTNQAADKGGGAGYQGVVVLTWMEPVQVDEPYRAVDAVEGIRVDNTVTAPSVVSVTDGADAVVEGGGPSVFDRAVDDATTAVEDVARGGVQGRPVGDAVGLADDVARGGVQGRPVDDAVGVADDAARGGVQGRPVDDVLGIVDDTTRGGVQGRPVADAATATDDATPQINEGEATHFDRAVGDAATVAEGTARGGLQGRPVGDPVTAVDGVTRGGVQGRPVAEAVGISDVSVGGGEQGRPVGDVSDASDAATASITDIVLNRSVGHDVAVAENVTSGGEGIQVSVTDVLAEAVQWGPG